MPCLIGCLGSAIQHECSLLLASKMCCTLYHVRP
jgi:hypothetical protein